MTSKRPIHAVVIGGGTGTFTVLSSLKHHVDDVTAIINMVDDGGSTGVLRDELGVLPPGDVRQALVALAPDSNLMRDLLNYRFEEGTFEGHPFGNIFLSVLEKTTGAFDEAVRTAGHILGIKGRVVPVTTNNTQLALTHPDGTTTRSQRIVEDSFFTPGERPQIFLDPPARLNPEAADALATANLVVFGPGNFYSSLVPNLLVEGMGEALRRSPATKVCVCNLVNKPGQTDGYKVHDFVDRLEEYVGGPTFDFVIYDNQRPDDKLLATYQQAGEEWVEVDEAALVGQRYTAIGAPLLGAAAKAPKQPKHAAVHRNLIRHDSEALAELLLEISLS